MKPILLFCFSVLATLLFSQTTKEYSDPIHFTPMLPTKKTVGDVMPFYWKGEYHIFYLTNPMGNHDVNWEHSSSRDLVNWKEYPPALKPDPNDPAGPEGGCMFTGCIVEKDDIFYAWYTSWNPDNPEGREFLSLATSKDLITWEKQPHSIIEQKTFTDGRVQVQGGTIRRGEQKRAAYVLHYTRDFPISRLSRLQCIEWE